MYSFVNTKHKLILVLLVGCQDVNISDNIPNSIESIPFDIVSTTKFRTSLYYIVLYIIIFILSPFAHICMDRCIIPIQPVEWNIIIETFLHIIILCSIILFTSAPHALISSIYSRDYCSVIWQKKGKWLKCIQYYSHSTRINLRGFITYSKTPQSSFTTLL